MEDAAAQTMFLSKALKLPRHTKDSGNQLKRLFNFLGRDPKPKSSNPVRIGVLGASQVATYALIWPANRCPDVEVAAVAAKDGKRAAEYAEKHGIPVSYGSYDDLINDPTLTAIYVATPNGLHGDWAAAALKAGKHVLCEKPFTADAAEAKYVQRTAAKKGLLCREAFHYKEHPANQAVANILQSGAIGQLKQLDVCVCIPIWAFNKNDIRFQFKLAGGTMMDAGCYCAHTLRFFPGCSRPKVRAAHAEKLVDYGRVDGHMSAELSYPPLEGSVLCAGTVGRLEADLRHMSLWPTTKFTALGTKGRLSMDNFIMPFMGHTLCLTRMVPDTSSPSRKADSLGDGLNEQKQQIRVYGNGESNYYYQLTRFISDLKVLEDKKAPKQAKRAVKKAMEADAKDAIDNMTLIDDIYRAAGLPLRRPTHAFVDSKEARGMLPLGKPGRTCR